MFLKAFFNVFPLRLEYVNKTFSPFVHNFLSCLNVASLNYKCVENKKIVPTLEKLDNFGKS